MNNFIKKLVILSMIFGTAGISYCSLTERLEEMEKNSQQIESDQALDQVEFSQDCKEECKTKCNYYCYPHCKYDCDSGNKS